MNTSTLLLRGSLDETLDAYLFVQTLGGEVENMRLLPTGEWSLLGRVPKKPEDLLTEDHKSS